MEENFEKFNREIFEEIEQNQQEQSIQNQPMQLEESVQQNVNSNNQIEPSNEQNEAKIEMIVISKNDLQKFENSEAYNVKLENFEGPLDLLLYLIKDSKAEIENIKLAMITDQYLEYMKQLDSIDMEKAAEFIEIAATLLEIKSKHLLPQEVIENPDIIDDEKLLLIRLKEYQMFKEAGEKLKQQENIDRLYKAPDETCNDFRTILKQMNVENLINAFTKLLTKTNIEIAIEEPKTIERDRWTVEEKEFEIKTLLIKKDSIKFFEIVDESFTRGEIITTFMALLEMLKRQEIEVSQDEKYGDIIINKGENIDG